MNQIANKYKASILATKGEYGSGLKGGLPYGGSYIPEVLLPGIQELALAFDHRLIDGAMAGAFLARFKELVENPQQLMLDMI